MAGLSAKICGLTDTAAVAAAVAGGAAFAGFVFFPPSPRNLGPARAGELIAGLAPDVTPVGVFADPTDDQLEAVLAAAPLCLIQLHGKETPARAGEIKDRFGLPVMKAVPVAGPDDVARAEGYVGSVDWLMFDAKAPETATRPGGNALSFDWELLAAADWPLPWMLSGGLDADNLAQAAQVSGARVVDVSSGVEDRPGVKNPEKIRAFLEIARTL
jgi:phosphoribosylanthranilate isomerase